MNLCRTLALPLTDENLSKILNSQFISVRISKDKKQNKTKAKLLNDLALYSIILLFVVILVGIAIWNYFINTIG